MINQIGIFHFNKGILQKSVIHMSPIFLLIVFTTIIVWFLSYNNIASTCLWIFIFVTSGWIVSLSLHEFGHAYAAFSNGDRSVVDKGYLSLNPMRYPNIFISIVLPIIFLMMGGIVFPGGAVYINVSAIKSKPHRSMVSAAGPFATSVFALLLLSPFFLGLDKSAGLEQSAF